jgi:hypothetical protein
VPVAPARGDRFTNEARVGNWSVATGHATRLWWLGLSAAWLVSAAYAAAYLLRGWVPHDEGTFGETALRVLQGQVPHRDFDDVYTGGLSYLHALAFHVLGISSVSLRITLFAWFLAWVPAVYFIASRFVSAGTAAGVVLLAAAWSLPNYAAPAPSWYNLFFATFGAAAVLLHLSTQSRSWLFIAGLCGGLSILAKSPGVYYVAGVLLFLLFREQSLSAAACAQTNERAPAYRFFVAASVLGLVAVLFALVCTAGTAPALVQFVLPGTALAAVVLWREWRGVPASDRRRFAALWRMALPFGLGVVVPFAIFLAPYVASGSLATLINGLLTEPMKRLAFSVMELPPLWAGVCIVPLLILLAAAKGPPWLRWAAGIVGAAALAAVLALSGTYRVAYAFAWHGLDLLPPLIVLVGAALVARWPDTPGVAALRREQVMLVLCVTAFANIVRYPFSAPVYFCYVAPLVVLSVVAVLSSLRNPPRLALATLAVFYTLFAVVRFTPGFIYAMGSHYEPDVQTQALTLPRAGGLRVSPKEAAEYERLIPLIQQHAGGDFIYAGNDSPEVSFLSGLRNASASLFEFFEDAAGRKERILDALATHDVHVVAISTEPGFTPRDPALEAALAERFPHAETVGRFEVRWRP